MYIFACTDNFVVRAVHQEKDSQLDVPGHRGSGFRRRTKGHQEIRFCLQVNIVHRLPVFGCCVCMRVYDVIRWRIYLLLRRAGRLKLLPACCTHDAATVFAHGIRILSRFLRLCAFREINSFIRVKRPIRRRDDDNRRSVPPVLYLNTPSTFDRQIRSQSTIETMSVLIDENTTARQQQYNIVTLSNTYNIYRSLVSECLQTCS